MDSFRRIREAVLAGPGRAALPYGDAAAPTEERLAAIRGAGHLQDLLAEIRAEAARARTASVPPLPFSQFRRFEADGDRRGYEGPYFARRGRLLGLVLDAVVNRSDAPLTALEDLLWVICAEYAWEVPAHLSVGVEAKRTDRLPPGGAVDLFAAETAHALAETVFLLGDRLHPWLPQRVRGEIERRVFRPLFHDPVHRYWESAANNWAAVCGGAAGMAALLLEEDRERLAGMVARVLGALGSFLDGFGADGGCAEGIGYWVYGFGYYAYFAEMLRAYTGGRLDPLAGERIGRIAAFPAGVNLTGDRFVAFSDAAARADLPTGLLSRLAARLNAPLPALERVPSLHSDHCYRWGHTTRNLFWTDPALLGRPAPRGPAFFPDLAWLIARHDLAGTPVAFAVKGGHNAEPHNHNDLGHFILHLGGEDLLTDLGAGLYTRQYFREGRYGFLHPSSAGHSVPLIDGEEQRAGREREARVLHHEAGDDGAAFELDLTRAYGAAGLLEFRRRFAWAVEPAAGRARLELTDAFRFAAPPGSLTEVLISLREPAIGAGTAVWLGARGAITLAFDAARLRPTLETIPSQDHLGRAITVYRLRLDLAEPGEREECRLVFTCAVEGQGAPRAPS